jgi:hypothetical protein
MSYCRQPATTDAALTHLQGIHTLSLRGCTQPTITGSSFFHLAGIKTLSLSSTVLKRVARELLLGDYQGYDSDQTSDGSLERPFDNVSDGSGRTLSDLYAELRDANDRSSKILQLYGDLEL